jgi:hypothetical protein
MSLSAVRCRQQKHTITIVVEAAEPHDCRAYQPEPRSRNRCQVALPNVERSALGSACDHRKPEIVSSTMRKR